MLNVNRLTLLLGFQTTFQPHWNEDLLTTTPTCLNLLKIFYCMNSVAMFCDVFHVTDYQGYKSYEKFHYKILSEIF